MLANNSLTVGSPRSTAHLIDAHTFLPLVSGKKADHQIQENRFE